MNTVKDIFATFFLAPLGLISLLFLFGAISVLGKIHKNSRKY